jgi:hypothetical protein
MGRLIRDSSCLYQNLPDQDVGSSYLRLGIIREEIYDKDSDSFFYKVEAIHNGHRIYMMCKQLSHFGDIFNYEEWNVRAYPLIKKTESESPSYVNKPGETVIVAAICGVDLDGVILGGLSHPGRKLKRKEKEFAYYFGYNGVDISVDKDGAYKILFNGLPTNLDKLDGKSEKLPAPVYDTKLAGTFFTVLKDGSIELGDGAEKPQSIKVDKTNGKMTLTSGEIILSFDKEKKEVTCVSDIFTYKAATKISLETKDMEIKATQGFKLNSAKIAIGSSGVELLDSLVKIIEALGKTIINSPTGPCQPMNTSPTWPEVEAIKVKINSIKGSL